MRTPTPAARAVDEEPDATLPTSAIVPRSMNGAAALGASTGSPPGLAVDTSSSRQNASTVLQEIVPTLPTDEHNAVDLLRWNEAHFLRGNESCAHTNRRHAGAQSTEEKGTGAKEDATHLLPITKGYVMSISLAPSSPVLLSASTDAAHPHLSSTKHSAQQPSDKRLAPGFSPFTQFPVEILKTIAAKLDTQFPDKIVKITAAKLDKKGHDNLRLPDSTFKQAIFKVTPHLKLVHPNDLRTLIAAHTDAQGRIDCSRIKKITLSHSSFTDADLALLQKFTSLHEVDFSDCTKITGAGIAKLPRTVKVANFTGCNALTDEDMVALPPDLEKVNFTDCINLTAAAVAKLPRTVKVADFTGYTALANIGNDAFPPALEEVNFTDCTSLTDADVAKLPPTVKVANFTNCPCVSASMIESLSQRGVRITEVPPSFEPAPGASHRRQQLRAAAIGPDQQP
jgi:hypothetical protein